MSLRVLMFGWEFPPYISGGLGTACYGITKGLANKGVKVTFVVPHHPDDSPAEHVNLVVASKLANFNVEFKHVTTLLKPYMTEETYSETYAKHYANSNNSSNSNSQNRSATLYGKNLYEEIHRFAKAAEYIATHEHFDIIHCHDWMTMPAGMAAKKVSGKPLVVHIHSTEFDRGAGLSVNQYVYDMEKDGMNYADAVIAVSNFTKQKIMHHYGILDHKIIVIHNAVEFSNVKIFDINKRDKVVLFLGRLTIMKGPDYFVEAAKKVLDYDPDVKFVMAGTGDMELKLVERVAQLGIGNKFLFAGFVSGHDVDLAYQCADLFVMPSVSEPFGIVPLEAMRNNVPVIISKQSGISEVLKHALKVDFWDIDEMANKIISVLNYRSLHREMSRHGAIEVKTFSWNIPAEKYIDVYNQILSIPLYATHNTNKRRS